MSPAPITTITSRSLPRRSTHMSNTVARRAMIALALTATLGLSACGGDDEETSTTGGSGTTTQASGSDGGGKGGKIAFLLPESKTARYETLDRPLFEAKVKEI